MSRHREVEYKFALEAGESLPDLVGVDGVVEVGPPVGCTLDAMYYDTATRGLTARGVTLRRRSGGSDAGWHLKLPDRAAGSMGRTEVRAGLDEAGAGALQADVPEGLVREAAVLVRGRPLDPIARIRTTRVERFLSDATGRQLAVMADDTVESELVGDESSSTRRWREVEVELIDGEPALLDAIGAAFSTAGLSRSVWPSKLRHALGESFDVTAEPTSRDLRSRSHLRAGEVVMAHLSDQVDELVARDPGARVNATDSVHAMRIAARRLRSALGTFGPLFHRSRTDPLRDDLRWLGLVLGRPRDAEVLRDRLVEEARALPSILALGPVVDRVDLEMRRRQRDALTELDRVLSEPRYFALLDALDHLLDAPPLRTRATHPAEEQLAKMVARACRKVDRAAQVVDRAPSPSVRLASLHDLRKAAKGARYAAEAVEVVFGRRAVRLASRMEQLQELLGEHQDSVTTREALRELGVIAHLSGENGFSFGLLYGQEIHRSERALADLDRVRRRTATRSVRSFLPRPA